MNQSIRYNQQRGDFDVLDLETGDVVPDDQLAPALLAALGRGGSPAPVRAGGELFTGAITGEIPLGRGRAHTTSSIVHVPSAQSRPAAAAQLTASDLEVCRQMNVNPADFAAARARQPHRWASEPFFPGGTDGSR